MVVRGLWCDAGNTRYSVTVYRVACVLLVTVVIFDFHNRKLVAALMPGYLGTPQAYRQLEHRDGGIKQNLLDVEKQELQSCW